MKIPLKFVPTGLVNKILELVQMMAWRRPGDKPLFEPMLVILLTHKRDTRPQWVKAVNLQTQQINWRTTQLCAYNMRYTAANWQNDVASCKPILIIVELLLKRRWKQIRNVISFFLFNLTPIRPETRVIFKVKQ